MVASSPREALLEEAGLCEVRKVAEGRWAVELEKCYRVEERNLRWRLAREEVRQRLAKRGWRVRAKEVMEEKIGNRVPRSRLPRVRAPWKRMKGLRVEIEGGKSDNKEENKRRGMAVLKREETSFDVVIYTDGSASEGRNDGGAGCVVTKGGCESPTMVESRERPAGRICSSFQAEMRALDTALE